MDYFQMNPCTKIIFILFWISSTTVFTQENDFVLGQLLDEKSQKAVPFATILLKNKSKGLISNADGSFKVPSSYYASNDTIAISSIGYISKEIPLTTLSLEKINTIHIKERIDALEELVLVGPRIKIQKTKELTAREIIRRAVKGIPQNYPIKPFSYIGYYRDYQLKQGKYVNLNESILRVFDPGFHLEDIKNTQTQIYSYQNNSDFPRDTLAAGPYDYKQRSKVIPNATLSGQGGNEFIILRLHDAIRNHDLDTYDFINRLDVDIIRNHRVKKLTESKLNDTRLYVIHLKRTQENYKALGKVYISKEDFKIFKMKYAVYDTGASNASDKNVSKEEKSEGLKLYEVIVEYQLENRKMYPKYISFNNSFDLTQPPKFKPILITINKEKKRFEIDFNNLPLEATALKKRNYRLWYQKEKLSIDSIALRKNTVLLYPKDRKDVFNNRKILLRKSKGGTKVQIEMKNIKDIDGNVVNEREKESYTQYREFFVQELVSPLEGTINSPFMIKNKSIFKGQPIKGPANLSDYWLNSPLKI